MLGRSLRTTLVPLALALATAALGGAAAWQAEQLWAADQRDAAAKVSSGAAFALEQQVSRALSSTYALAALVRHDQELKDFERIATQILPLFQGVDSLQLAPGAVIRRIHPLAGNEAAIGHDLLNDPKRRAEAQAAISSRQLTVAGPFELKQGGSGLVGRLAVFLADQEAPGGERLWGLVAALVRLPPLLQAAGLSRLDDAGYAWRLTRTDPGNQSVTCFAGCDRTLAAPVTFDVDVPNGAWTLAVAPSKGWPPAPWSHRAWWLLLAAAVGFALLSRQVLLQPERLQREVTARTEELAHANAALAAEMSRLREAEEATRTAEERLRHSQKLEAVGQLAGGIAHDFNNLLTGILGHASVLEEESPAGSDAAVAGATITAAARRGAELTRGLLAFARPQPVRALPFDAHAVVGEVVRLLERTLDPRLLVQMRCTAPRAVILGDPIQLHQALLNLAFNARDAMPEGGELTLVTEQVERDDAWRARHPDARGGPHLAISVRDTGHGVPEALQHRVFEPFFTTKAAGEGSGLGLATVYGLARAHGGGVDLVSQPGQGACFTISVPLAPPGVEVEAPRAPGGGRAAAAGLVLVVDDDDLPRRAMATMLQAVGYEPVATGSASEGLRWLEANPGRARAVLLDVAMPGMDGVACFGALRGLDARVPVVFTSGYARAEGVQALVARGEAGFLSKPFDHVELAAAIEEAERRCRPSAAPAAPTPLRG